MFSLFKINRLLRQKAAQQTYTAWSVAGFIEGEQQRRTAVWCCDAMEQRKYQHKQTSQGNGDTDRGRSRHSAAVASKWRPSANNQTSLDRLLYAVSVWNAENAGVGVLLCNKAAALKSTVSMQLWHWLLKHAQQQYPLRQFTGRHNMSKVITKLL